MGFWTVCFLLVFLARESNGGYCTQYYSCATTCYKSERYTTCCGFMCWDRCGRYRSVSYGCTTTCSRQVCCAGYTGRICTTPICFGSESCPNGGRCLSPNYCECNAGFASPTCDDINECSTTGHGCQQNCVNTHGSYHCSCRTGYMLNSDLKTCIDSNECKSNTTGCEHLCINTPGSFYCGCKDGYRITADGKTCTDIDECKEQTHSCAHSCSNTEGTYNCSCQNGYMLGLDGKTCDDIDECSNGEAKCAGYCQNTPGAYSCFCRHGFILGEDGVSCHDIDECSSNGTKCDHICNNLPGSYTCDCYNGYKMESDSCIDIDECDEATSGCSQLCTNVEGSYACSCDEGFYLRDDNETCLDIDDCEDVGCNNGDCVDGVNSFTCFCEPGYTGSHCDTDVNECEIFNGGCHGVCINTEGSFLCVCSDGRTLQPDGYSCSKGEEEKMTVFQRYQLPRNLLPKACFTILFTKCFNENPNGVLFASTSEWYKLNTNNDIIFTHGIVFIKVHSFSVPISLQGLELTRQVNNFVIKHGVQYNSTHGSMVMNDTNTPDCASFNVQQSDLVEFIGSNSFPKTFLSSLISVSPNWLRLETTDSEILSIQDLQSEILFGRDIDGISHCSGAPVLFHNLYTVFTFGTGFTMRIMKKEIVLPKPFKGNKFCLIVDLCQDQGRTLFLMIPKESQNLLLDIDIFRILKETKGLLILPRGIGISLTKSINTARHDVSAELWNGLDTFKPTLPNVNFWIGGDFIKEEKQLKIAGAADIYIGVPEIETMMTSIFREEWTALVSVEIKVEFPSVRMKVFGKEFVIPLKPISGRLNVFLSFGGHDRLWCHPTNPSGAFLSASIEVNHFYGIPLIGDSVIKHQIYAFAVSETKENSTPLPESPVLRISALLGIVDSIIASAVEVIMLNASNSVLELINEVQESTTAMKTLISRSQENTATETIDTIADLCYSLRVSFSTMENSFERFSDSIEFLESIALSNLTNALENYLDSIRLNINNFSNSLTTQLATSAGEYTGFGLKYIASTFSFFNLKFSAIEFEFISPGVNISRCNPEDKYSELLAGERAARYTGRAYEDVTLNMFMLYKTGAMIGIALSEDTNKFVFRLQVSISMIGIHASADMFIKQNGIYFYLEGDVWGLFSAHVSVSADLGKHWFELILKLKGRFLVKQTKKRDIDLDRDANIQAFKQARKERYLSSRRKVLNRNKRKVKEVNSSFRDSYLDALKRVIQLIGVDTQNRISFAQNSLTSAQNDLNEAKNWLEMQKHNLRTANIAFDNAVSSLEQAKVKLEEARRPFQRALTILRDAEKDVDNLCKIRTCAQFCIPGIKCDICHKKAWGVSIPYPCCSFTDCMIRFPDPVCVAYNVICSAARAVAYAALQAADIAVRAPMLAFDAANKALTVAQFVVDKSRVSVKVAEGILELAKTGLNIVNESFEAAKHALQVVKTVIGAAVELLSLLIKVGLQSIIDVRNCGFEIELSTSDLPIFDVFCDVNPFKLGWRKVTFKINFKNILQSIWQAARETVSVFLEQFGDSIVGRRKREIEFESSSKLHVLLREIRSSGFDNETVVDWNDTVNILSITGFSGGILSESENRIQIFEEKCKISLKIQVFLTDLFTSIEEVVNDSRSYMNEVDNVTVYLQTLGNNDNITDNIKLESSGINVDIAANEFNVSEDDLERVLNETKPVIAEDALMMEINSTTRMSLENIKNETQAVESIDYFNVWLNLMKNMTLDYFNNSECETVTDCIFFSISSLYQLYEYEDIENITEIRDSILDLEAMLIEIFQNESTTLEGVALVIEFVIQQLNTLLENNIFCSKPPRFVSHPQNLTIMAGKSATFVCSAEGDPVPKYMWYKNTTKLQESTNRLVISNVIENDSFTMFSCVAENIVTGISSEAAYLFVIPPDDTTCVDTGVCRAECTYDTDAVNCHCLKGFQIHETSMCGDINECVKIENICEVSCINFWGTYGCHCLAGYKLNKDGRSCEEVLDWKLSTTIVLDFDGDETDLHRFSGYSHMTADVHKALDEHYGKFITADFSSIVHQIRYSSGSLVVEFTVILFNSSKDELLHTHEAVKATFELAHGARIHLNGHLVEAKGELPGNLTEPCEIMQFWGGKCKDGYSCHVTGNAPTCRLEKLTSASAISNVPVSTSLSAALVTIAIVVAIVVLRRRKRYMFKISDDQSENIGIVNLTYMPTENETEVNTDTSATTFKNPVFTENKAVDEDKLD